jgi:HEAT repeat protein
MRTKAFLSLTTLVLATATAHADPPVPRDAVVHALSGFERGPDAATVRTWDPTTLMDIASDSQALTHVRVRAVYSLRLFATPAVHDYLRRFAGDEALAVTLRRGAIDALAEGFADVPEVSRYLRASDVSLRDGAAWALGRLRTPPARAALEEALRSETHPTVRATMQSALATH